MRRMLRWALMVLGLAAPCPAMAETIVLAADSYCPLNCEQDAPEPGYAIEIAKAVFERHGITVQYRVLPWSRAIAEAKSGHIDGVIGASGGKAGFLYPRESVGVEKFVLIAAADSTWSYSGPASLANRKIGVVVGYELEGPVGDHIRQNLHRPDLIDPASGPEAEMLNLKKLVSGRIDALIDDESVVRLQISRLGLERKVRVAGTVTPPAPIYVAFSERRPQGKRLLKLWDDGIADLRRDGRLANILSRYGLSDWK